MSSNNSNPHQELNEFVLNLCKGIVYVAGEVNKIMIPIATKIHNYLKNIDPEKVKNFVLALEKYQHNEPYIQKLIKEIESNANLQESFEVLSLSHIMSLIDDNNEDLEKISILDILNTNYYQKYFWEVFDSIEIGDHFKKRKSVLQEAFELYESEYFAGCITLLYGQLEGILTDYLIFNKQLNCEENSTFYLGPSIKDKATEKIIVKKNNKITGIRDKIIIAKEFDNYFSRLDAYKLDGQLKINNDRNDILHGSILDRYTKERCFVVFIWLDSIFMFLRNSSHVKPPN